ncbi:MAG: hypothetical protein K1X95_03570 [Acidimicrobiia bacterium]|nr:hypothetical protein [Acidimicrobiia bacterium]
MSKVRIGVSTVILWIAALAAAAGAAAQVVGDKAPWLAVVAATLVAVNNAARSWQAVAGGTDGP